jgi:hypothetical protein
MILLFGMAEGRSTRFRLPWNAKPKPKRPPDRGGAVFPTALSKRSLCAASNRANAGTSKPSRNSLEISPFPLPWREALARAGRPTTDGTLWTDGTDATCVAAPARPPRHREPVRQSHRDLKHGVLLEIGPIRLIGPIWSHVPAGDPLPPPPAIPLYAEEKVKKAHKTH